MSQDSNLLAPSPDGLAQITAWEQSAHIAAWLGFSAHLEEAAFRYHLQFAEHHIGNSLIRALHGGVVSSFLQAAAVQEMRGRTPDGICVKMISIHTSYLRPAKDKDMHAKATFVQAGRRVAFVEMGGWQDSPDKPTARAQVALRLLPAETP